MHVSLPHWRSIILFLPRCIWGHLTPQPPPRRPISSLRCRVEVTLMDGETGPETIMGLGRVDVFTEGGSIIVMAKVGAATTCLSPSRAQAAELSRRVAALVEN